MTLVVVKQLGDIISAVCDTMVTQADGSRPNEKTLVKLVVLDNDKAIAFSGSTHYATTAIRNYRAVTLKNRMEITNFFLDEHRNSGQSADFILMYCKPSQVIAIKNSKTEKMTASKTCWIGEQSAFQRFQEYWHNRSRPSSVPGWEIPKIATDDPTDGNDKNQVFRMLLSLRYVIVEGSIPSVGGFMAGLSNVSGVFKFVKYALVLDSNFKAVPARSLLRIEIEEQQAYAQSCIVSLPESPVQSIAFHFSNGFLTYMYVDNGAGVLDNVQIVSDKTFAEFEEITLRQFGLKWNAFLVDRRGVTPPGNRGFDPRRRLSSSKDVVEVVQK